MGYKQAQGGIEGRGREGGEKEKRIFRIIKKVRWVWLYQNDAFFLQLCSKRGGGGGEEESKGIVIQKGKQERDNTYMKNEQVLN